MHFSRWTNPSLPQLLQIATFLLYFTGAFGILGLLGIGGFSTPWYLLGVELFPRAGGAQALVGLAAAAGYILAGLMIANEQKRGWLLGSVLAIGGVVLPVLVAGVSAVLGSSYIVTFLFDVALMALLLHPQTREHQKIWFT